MPTARGFRWAGLITNAAIGCLLLWWSWGKWLSPVLDFGRELYVPWQLGHGKLLYVDLAYFNGPLSPYLNALGFSLLGVSLRSLVILNALVLIGTVVLLYLLVRRFAGSSTAAVGIAVFLICFAFADPTGAGNYNFITPYSHEMTHGFLLALTALACLFRYVERQSRTALIATGLATGLVFLTKSELFVAIAPVALLGCWLAHRTDRLAPARAWRRVAVLALAIAAPALVAFVLLLAADSPSTALRGVLGPWPYALMSELRGLRFYRGIMGVLDPAASLRRIALWLAVYGALFLPAVFVARRTPPTSRWRGGVAAAVAVLVALLTLLVLSRLEVVDVARPAPVLLATMAAALAVHLARGRAQETAALHRSTMALLATLFALALLLKIILRVQLSHYGFVLAVPAVVLLVAVLLQEIPDRIDRAGGWGAAFRAAAISFVVVVTLTHFLFTERAFRRKVYPVGQGADRFTADEAGAVVEQTVRRLQILRRPGESLAVLPEGVLLNYLLRIENPTPFLNFMPPEHIMFGDDTINDAFRRSPPDLIVMTNRGASEYGYEFLGQGYGDELARWVRDHYRMVERIRGPGSDNQQSLGWTMILRYGPS